MKEKLCDTCRYRNNVEQLKPCIIYRDNCEYYEKERGSMKPLEERISYSVICEQMPEPKVYHPSFIEAVEWAKSNQPLYRPYYIVERVEHFEVCGIVEDTAESEEDMSEVGVEIIKTEETEKSGTKYLNINVSNSEVERNPDVVRLCADAGILEYVKPSGDAISREAVLDLCDSTDPEYKVVHFKEDVECLPSVNPQKSCDTCKHSDETDGSHCYECVKGMRDNYDLKESKTDVLDKIRAEIAEYKDDKIIHEERNEMIDIVLEIIDKHIRGTDNE